MRGAFVIRLGPGTEPVQGRFEGSSVEEVDTGRRVKFHSTEELLRFLGQSFEQLCAANENSINAKGNRTTDETVESPRRKF
jgi:hypothetical protein